MFVHQLGVLGRHEIAQPAAGEVGAVRAHHRGKLPVGIENDLAMHQHRLVDALAELGEEFRRHPAALALGRGARQQMVDCRDQDRQLRLRASRLHAAGERAADGNALQLLR